MSSTRLVAVVLILIGVVSLIWTFNPLKGTVLNIGSTKKVETEKSIDAGKLENIKIMAGSSDVNISRGGSEQVKVRLSGKISAKHEDEFQLLADSRGDTLELKVQMPNGAGSDFFSRDIQLDVELPAKNWDSLTVESGSGDIKAERIEARAIDLRANSGNIELDRYTTDKLTFRTNSGDVTLSEGQSALVGETDSGNITVETEDLRHDTKLKSGSGDVKVRLDKNPDSLAVLFETNSGDGQINRSGMKETAASTSRKGIQGSFGSGKTELKVNTASGNFTLE